MGHPLGPSAGALGPGKPWWALPWALPWALGLGPPLGPGGALRGSGPVELWALGPGGALRGSGSAGALGALPWALVGSWASEKLSPGP